VRSGAEEGEAVWASTWLEDARWELPGRSVHGRDDIVALWRTSMNKNHRVVQIYNSAVFDVEGDDATGRVQLVELVSVADGSKTVLAGHYDDTYRRTPDGWKFASRALTIYYRGAPDLSGTFA
jgi:hypothetical protein